MSMGLHSSSRRRGSRAPMAEINVTPLVDVMLVLLIIFMVAAPLMLAGVPVDLPDSKAAALDQEDEPVQLSIDAQGEIFLGEEPITEAQLAGRLRAIASEADASGGPRVYLRADRGLDYGRVMRVMGELNRAGLNRVALVSVGTDG
ncbi:MAG TPA: protein TolR [Sphingomonadaceae bacterium]|nr:protein TolR [Sphingomonadaceae bacterium]